MPTHAGWRMRRDNKQSRWLDQPRPVCALPSQTTIGWDVRAAIVRRLPPRSFMGRAILAMVVVRMRHRICQVPERFRR